jgi:hypothetical protein
MKNKVTIMNERQRIADEEIDRFKNFDALLKKYQHSTTSRTNTGINGLKWVVSILGLVIIGSSVVYLTIDKKQEIANDEMVKVEPVPAEKTENGIVTESIADNEVKQSEPQQKVPTVQTPKQKPAVKKEATLPALAPVYVQAEPLEGYAHLYNYFNAELIYPVAALKDSIQGVLTVSFTINKDGLPENLQYTNSLGEAFEEETKRLILNMPAWKPATLNDEPVSSRLSLPLTFQIQSVKKQTN